MSTEARMKLRIREVVREDGRSLFYVERKGWIFWHEVDFGGGVAYSLAFDTLENAMNAALTVREPFTRFHEVSK